MPGSNGRTPRKPAVPTWAEWSAMHWRERQRTRRQLAEHGLEPPAPPPTFQLPLDPKQVRQLEKLARQAQVTRDEYAAFVIGKHLAAKATNRRPSRQKAEAQNG